MMDWTPDSINWFFAQSPPRQVDEGLLNDALKIVFPKFLRVLIHVLPAFMLISMALFTIVVYKIADLRAKWKLETGSRNLASGEVLAVEVKTGSKGSRTYIHTFVFRPAERAQIDDPPLRGTCFSDSPITSPGQTVPIEYLPDDPRVSRIEGCRLTPVPLAAIIAVPFLGLIGAVVPVAMLRYKQKWLHRLLTFGTLTQAIIEKLDPGPGGALMVFLRYRVAELDIQSKTQTSGWKQRRDRLTWLYGNAEAVLILVDPDRPKSLFLLDLLSKTSSV